MRDKIKKAAYTRQYFSLVRATVLPVHEYTKQTCCRDCLRQYNRKKMNEYRARSRGENLTSATSKAMVSGNSGL